MTTKAVFTKELKELAKTSGYLTIKNFIKDFELNDIATLEEIQETSKNWKLAIRKGHSFQYITGSNFGW